MPQDFWKRFEKEGGWLKDQCLKISGKGLKKKVVGYRIVWKYGWRQKYGWVLRPKVVGGHVSFGFMLRDIMPFGENTK